MASSTAAASATVRVIGPAMSCVSAAGMIPLRLTSPRVGRRPTRSQAEAGERIEFTVSLPRLTAAMFAATAAAGPPLEPPGVRARSYGLSVWPPSELTVVPARASSCRLPLPRKTAPAWRSFATTKASSCGCAPAKAIDPPVVGRSLVFMLSLSTTGMPCSGPRAPFLARSWSRASASASARGLRSRKAFSFGPALS